MKNVAFWSHYHISSAQLTRDCDSPVAPILDCQRTLTSPQKVLLDDTDNL